VRLGPGVPAGPLPAGEPGGSHPRRGELPGLPARVRNRSLWRAPGGIMTYASDQLLEEVAYVAYHFHWPFEEILDLEHPLRRRFVEEIGRINERLNQEG